MLNRRDFFKMIGLAGLGGIFARELLSIPSAFAEPEIFTPSPAWKSYYQAVSVSGQDVLIQVASTAANLDHYAKKALSQLASGEELWHNWNEETWHDWNEGKAFYYGDDIVPDQSYDVQEAKLVPGRTDWRRDETDFDYLNRILPNHPDYKAKD